MRPRSLLLGPLLAAGCAGLDVPPPETAYYADRLALAQTDAPTRPASAAEGAALRASAATLGARASAEIERIRESDETEGLLDLRSADARRFLGELDAARLSAGPLGLEQVLLAAWARSPEVQAARDEWRAAVRMYDQASYLEDLLLRYSAFARRGTMPVGARPMSGSAFPYPGLLALKGEMVDAEVEMARERLRMRLLSVLAQAAEAWHELGFAQEDESIRREQLALAERMLVEVRAGVESGRSPQAELLEMEAELAMAENALADSVAARATAAARLNTLLAREVLAPIAAADLPDPPAASPERADLLALADRYSPEARIARAEARRTAVAIRMAEAMLFAPPPVGAVAPGAAGSMGPSAAGGPDAAPAGDGMGGMDGMGPGATTAAQGPVGLSPREPAPGGAPTAFGPDVAWVQELRERLAAAERRAEEAVLAARRDVVAAHYRMDAAQRMYDVASGSSEPLSRQAVEERLRLYGSGRTAFADLVGSYRRHLDALRDVAQARHEHGMALATAWTAAGARPSIVRAAEEAREDK